MIVLINILLFSFLCNTYAAPVRKDAGKSEESNVFKILIRFNQSYNYNLSKSNDLHYKNYLEEIIKELEKDPAFSEKVKQAQEKNRTQHIAQSLKFVHHKIRNKLDEIKRREIDRLNILENELERKRLELAGGKVGPPKDSLMKMEIDKDHLNHLNVHSFEINDLEMLIKKTEEDLLKVDKEQEEQYKEYEMKKSYLKKKKLEGAKDTEERKTLEKNFSESEKRHKDHPKVHHPGNEEQLKEVWDKGDHLDPKEFNPLAFFNLHDNNADGHLDINEIEALMQNELTKVYEANNSDDDLQERYHEMMRMRQEMLNSMDTNKDKMVSKEEFLKYSSSSTFKDDTEWKTQEEQDKPYSDEEYKHFEDAYPRGEEEEDDFSDLDESLRYVPRNMNQFPNPPISEQHVPDKSAQHIPPPEKLETKPDNNPPPPVPPVPQHQQQPQVNPNQPNDAPPKL